MLTKAEMEKAESERKEVGRAKRIEGMHAHMALRVKRAKRPVQLGLFEPQQMQLI